MVLTPRELWHDCDHQHHEIENSDQDHFEQKDCFACDYHLGIIDQPVLSFFSFGTKQFNQQVILGKSVFIKREFQQFSHRGPPNV